MSFTLSSEGVDHWEEVVAELYRYIGMLRFYCSNQGGLPSWIHEELRSIHELSYRFKDEESPDEYVQELAEKMVPHSLVDPEHLLDGDALLFDHDEATVKVSTRNCHFIHSGVTISFCLGALIRIFLILGLLPATIE